MKLPNNWKGIDKLIFNCNHIISVFRKEDFNNDKLWDKFLILHSEDRTKYFLEINLGEEEILYHLKGDIYVLTR